MKNYLGSVFFLLMNFFSTFILGQYDCRNTPVLSQTLVNNSTNKDNPKDFNSSTGIPCHPNSFWAIDGTGRIEEFSIVGNTISSSGITLSTSPGRALAYCNDLNNGSFSPTFYSHAYSISTASYVIYKFNGVSWDTLQDIPPLPNGCGGSGNFMYYQSDLILKYDGAVLTPIYALTSAVADIAVDDVGNVYCFDKSNPDQKLKIISPSGQVLKQYNINPFIGNAYGCFLLNSILYVGLGGTHSLIPFTLTEDSAIAGVPLDMPNVSYSDLASCNAGNPLAVEMNLNQPIFNIFPNPATEVLNITIKSDEKNYLSIYSYNGELLKTISTESPKIEIDIRFLADGIYFIENKNAHGIARKKFIKM